MCEMSLKRGMILMTCLALQSVVSSAEFAGGTGVPNDPYQIATAEQLVSIGSEPTLMDKHFVLINDIDLAGSEWYPIGIFNGVFDGNDRVISNPCTTFPDGLECSGRPLFARTGDRAIIKNLILTNSAVIPSPRSGYAGALVNYNAGTVKNCRVQATLTGSECGGLAGQNTGLIMYCDVTCSISSDSGVRQTGCLVGENRAGSVFACKATGSITCGYYSVYVGGLVGASISDACVIACSADVNITCGDKSERVGGLVGVNWGTVVAESHASGVLTTGAQCKYVGGLVGENGSGVLHCYASGAVVVGDATVDSGGLVGSLSSQGKVTDSYFLAPSDGGGPDNGIGTSLTDFQMRQQSSFVGLDFATSIQDGVTDLWVMSAGGGYPVLNMLSGYDPPVLAGTGTANDPYLLDAAEQLGFAARNPGACYRLVADLDLAGIVSTTAAVPLIYGRFDGNGHTVRNLTMAGGSYMGLFGTVSAHATVVDLGVVDANIAGSDTSRHVAVLAAMNKGAIARCAVIGTVTGGEQVGGLTGENEGEITDCYATCSITGARHAGGLVGENNGTITNSYANGQVSSSSDEWGIGALVGYNGRGSLVNCFWEKRDGMVIAGDLCQGLTTSQMTDQEVYGLNGWAENPNWVIDSGNDYPRLAWEGSPGQPIPTPTMDWLAGSGTPEAPYLIETVDQLKLIGIASILWDKHFALTSNLDCGGVQLERIGVCPGTGFSGDFDGANHRITNLTLGSNSSRQRNLGLFGYIDPEGCVSRLIMENVRVSCGALSGPVAALAAENQGKIVNCGAAGSLDCGDTCWSVGGLVGRNYGIMDLCYADVAISAGSESRTIGGLSGSNDGHIANSYALGPVHGGSAVGSLGGLVGIADGPLVHCYAAGHITRAATIQYGLIGGLVALGSSTSTMVSCYFLGPDNHLGAKLSDEQMKEQASFVSWDFVGETANGTDDIWWILEGEDYPRLQWEQIEAGQ
ncbi:MAG: hypothetical protein ISS70_09320 [Phycisphaerae bacterium]|nr:hypothetical protein [Phycisphaerae bacterium]